MTQQLLIFWWFISSLALSYSQPSRLSPKEFFTHYGKEYHFQQDIMSYVGQVAEDNPHIQIQKIGSTYQGRPLHLIFISSKSNMAQLEDIRQTNLYNAGLITEKPPKIIEKALVWCSLGTHGNEAGTTGSVPQIVYELLNKLDDNPRVFDDVVVIIDPCVNPDGYDRYVHFVKSTSSQRWITDPHHREHMETWPSGRSNHYMFDLNRDWAWQTQKESKERVEAYNNWLPHIHADFHEMGYNANYYFAPAAQPYHNYLTDFQRQFQVEIGKNHAQYFDAKGWLYWTRELFDLLYPSYGDTYPTYNGAVGMTYEMAGNTASGRAILLKNGDTLSVQDKIDRNTVVALSTVEKSAHAYKRVIEGFKKFYDDGQKNPQGLYKSYILKKHPAMTRFTALLDRNKIRYSYAQGGEKLTGYHYASQSSQSLRVEEGDIFIQASQPKSTLLQVLMEEAPFLNDSLTYDITAWSLPLAYGLECYAFSSDVKVQSSTDKPSKNVVRNPEKKPIYSYEIEWNDLSSAQVAAALHQKGFKMRMTVKESSLGGRLIPKGTVFVHKDDNRRRENFEQSINQIFESLSFDNYHLHTSGFSDAGGDLGGNHYAYIDAPRALTFSGGSTSQHSVGEIWFYFDQMLNYELNIVDWDRFDTMDFSQFNVILLPEGEYLLDVNQIKTLTDWVNRGGRLVVIGTAVSKFENKEFLSVQRFVTEQEQVDFEIQEFNEQLTNRTLAFEDTERKQLSKITAGSIIKNTVDDTHPLGYGLGKAYFSLKTSSQIYPLQKAMWNVVRVPDDAVMYGFVGRDLKEKLGHSVTAAMNPQGKGSVIYFVDNPLFRCFWDRGLFIFSNAVFLINSVTPEY